MTCAEARQALLQADPEEMGGGGETPLSLHLRDCAACAHRAALLLREEALLGEGLLQTMPPVDLDSILAEAERDRALEENRVSPPGERSTTSGRWESRAPQVHRGRWRRLTLIPLAAAAAAALLLLSGEPRLPGDPLLPHSPAGVEAEAPPGRNLAVFRTADPDIIVVWLF